MTTQQELHIVIPWDLLSGSIKLLTSPGGGGLEGTVDKSTPAYAE